MKRFFLYLLSFLLLSGASFYLWLIKASHIPTLEFDRPILEASGIKKSKLRFSILDTGYSEVPEGFARVGGSWWQSVKLEHPVVLVDHPKGAFLFDAGLGSQMDVQLDRLPWYVAIFLKFTSTGSAKSQLEKFPDILQKIKFVILSHVHWDHTSGLSDFTHLPIKVLAAEHDWYLKEGDAKLHGILASAFSHPDFKWEIMTFQEKAYEGYDKNLDLFGDGAVVLVDMAGHTPGSVGMFLNLSAERRYFFIGDTTWLVDANGFPYYKSKLARIISDNDIPQTIYQLSHLRKLKEANPKIILVPQHDARTLKHLSAWPAWTSL